MPVKKDRLEQRTRSRTSVAGPQMLTLYCVRFGCPFFLTTQNESDVTDNMGLLTTPSPERAPLSVLPSLSLSVRRQPCRQPAVRFPVPNCEAFITAGIFESDIVGDLGEQGVPVSLSPLAL